MTKSVWQAKAPAPRACKAFSSEVGQTLSSVNCYGQRQTSRKAKKSYTLSPESVELLEELRKKRHASSASAVLEEILHAVRRESELAMIDRAVADYYSSLSEDAAEELSRWGEFALREFPKERA